MGLLCARLTAEQSQVPQLSPTAEQGHFGKAVRKGRKRCAAVLREKSWKNYVRNSPVNAKGREGGRALEQRRVSVEDHSGSGIHSAARENPTLQQVEIS